MTVEARKMKVIQRIIQSQDEDLLSVYEELGLNKVGMEIPQWQKEEVRRRKQKFGTDTDKTLDFNSAMNDMEESL